MNRPKRAPSALLARMLGTHDKDRQRVAEDAAQVRAYVEQNLLLGQMCLSVAPSGFSFSSVVSALRVAKLGAEATGQADLVRVIDGCEGPLQAILRRNEAGAMRATELELSTLSAACWRVLDALPEFADGDLVMAYELDRLYRQRQGRTAA